MKTMFYNKIFKTISAYRNFLKSKFSYTLFIFVFILGVVSTSIFVLNINKEIQDSFLSILSIIFPLIAGFLTFGRDTLKNIKGQINHINNQDEKDIGTPTTDSDKKKIKQLKDSSTDFIKIVISTFNISFILIIILLVAKFNNFEFITGQNFFPIKEFIRTNIVNLLMKVLFFYFIYIMFLNTLYLTIFIVKVSNNDDV